jgi:hypothetical protein
MSNRLLIGTAVTALLAGCAETAQQRATRQMDTCTGYGFAADSPLLPTCLLLVDQNDRNREAQRKAAVAAALTGANAGPHTVTWPNGQITTLY